MRPSLPYPHSGKSFLQFGHRYKINQTTISTAASTVFVITTGITRNESDGKKRITVLTTKSTRISPKPPLKIARITRNLTRRIILSPFVSKTFNLLCLWYQGSNASSIKQRSNGCKNEMPKRTSARLVLTSAFIFLGRNRYHGFNMMISCVKYCS